MAREKNIPALPWFFDAYLVDTMHLSTIEHGAYLLLLGHAWRQGGYLPDDDKKLASLTFTSAEEWAAIKPTVMDFWTLSKRGWSQKRLMKELRYVTDARNKRREAGKRGGDARSSNIKEKQGSNAKAMPEQCSSNDVAPNPNPSSLPKGKQEDAALFERAEEVLGKGCGGMVAKLKAAKGGSVELSRAAIEQAATKHKPREYIGAIINKAAADAGAPVRGSVGAI